MLIDMQMPEINGIQAIDYIRNQSELNAQTPIYIFSGSYPPDYNELVAKYLIQGIILKPFTIKEIEQFINKIKEK
jgi:CheY-like chemotaxis protein